MKQTVTESMFIDSFCGGYKDNFSYEGKKALFEWLDSSEHNCGTDEMELDPIALCCEYTEYHGLCEYLADYNGDGIETIDDISSLTYVIPIDDCSFIIQCY
jgi:hypothetical protein